MQLIALYAILRTTGPSKIDNVPVSKDTSLKMRKFVTVAQWQWSDVRSVKKKVFAWLVLMVTIWRQIRCVSFIRAAILSLEIVELRIKDRLHDLYLMMLL